MELRVKNGHLQLAGAFKVIATGYFLGAGLIFAPLFALSSLMSWRTGASPIVNGQEVAWASGGTAAILPILILPVVLALQAVLLGGLVVFGLWLYSKRRPIRVVEG